MSSNKLLITVTDLETKIHSYILIMQSNNNNANNLSEYSHMFSFFH